MLRGLPCGAGALRDGTRQSLVTQTLGITWMIGTTRLC